MAKEKRFNLGAKGVNVVASPVHLEDGALVLAQNVMKNVLGESGGIAKRFGQDLLKDTGVGSVIAFFNVALRPSASPHPTTGNPIVPGAAMYVKAFKSASLSIANATLTTNPFDSEDFDVGGFHDNAVNPERFTVPAGGDGIYLFVATCSWQGRGASGGRTAAHVFKNGIVTRVGIAEETPDGAVGDGNLGTTYSAVGFINMVAGDYLVMRVRQDSGAALNLLGASTDLTSFGMVRLFAL